MKLKIKSETKTTDQGDQVLKVSFARPSRASLRKLFTLDTSAIWLLVRKELGSFLRSPATYVVAIVYLIALFLLFLPQFFVYAEASLTGMFDILPWLMLFLIPALTMGLLSTELRDSTLEYLLTKPINEFQLIVAKYFSTLIFFTGLLLLTLPITLAISFYGDMDWGQVAGQYLAALSMACTFTGVGLFISSLTSSQIAAFLSSALVNFILIFAGTTTVLAGLPTWFTPIVSHTSTLTHYANMARGVIDLRDVIYFTVAFLLLLSLSHWSLLRRKYPVRSQASRYSRNITIVITVLLLLTVVATDRIPGRLDLTENGLYTVSAATNNVVSSLPAEVVIDLYASSELPAEYQSVLRQTQDLLAEYQRIGGGSLTVDYNYIGDAATDELATEATTAGVQPVQFNSYGGSEVQLKVGYLGLVVSHAGQTESIAFIESTDSLEYQLTSFINKLTSTNKPAVVFWENGAQNTRYSGYATFASELESQFTVSTYAYSADTPTLPENTSVLVVPGLATQMADPEIALIKQFVESGGDVLYLDDGVTVNIGTNSVDATAKELAQPFADYGVEITTNIVYDLASSETVASSNGIFQTYVPYPFWTLAMPVDTDITATSGIDTILMPWVSDLQIAAELPENVTVHTILSTSDYAAVDGQGSYNLSLDRQYTDQESDLSSYPLMVEIEVTNGDNVGSIILAGDSELFSDQYSGYKQNTGFGLRLVERLSDAASLSEIRIKNRAAAKLLIPTDADLVLLRYLAPASSILAVIILATVVWWRRRDMIVNGRYEDR